MRAVGAAFLVAACTLLGLCRARELHFHRRCVDDTLAALRCLDAELCAAAAPLPDVFAALAVRRESAVSGVFQTLAEENGGTLGARWAAVWLRDTRVALTPNERRSLARLGPVLGRYPADEQSRLVRGSIEELARAAERWEKREREGTKLSASVGLTLGLMLAAALV